MSLYPQWLVIDGRRYREELQVNPPAVQRVTIAWDDQNPDYHYVSRTQTLDLATDNPPAVLRFYPAPIDKQGDFRVDLATPYDWKPAIIALNGGGEEGLRRWQYLVGPARASYNSTGWPKQAYISFSGNVLEGEFVGEWFRFETLKPSDLGRVAGMTIQTHPQYVHRFTCVTFDQSTRTTKHIWTTGTPRGDVQFFLVTKEGVAYIPKRHVVKAP